MVSKIWERGQISKGTSALMLRSKADAIEILDLIPEPTKEDFEIYADRRNLNNLPTQNNKTLLSGNT